MLPFVLAAAAESGFPASLLVKLRPVPCSPLLPRRGHPKPSARSGLKITSSPPPPTLHSSQPLFSCSSSLLSATASCAFILSSRSSSRQPPSWLPSLCVFCIPCLP